MDAVRLKVLTGIFLLCSIFAVGWTPSARADTITDVSAAGAWSGIPRILGDDVETFAASLEWDATTLSVVPNSIVFFTTGPLGPFTYVGTFENADVNWSDAGGDSIQIFLSDLLLFESDPLGTPGAYNVQDLTLDITSSDAGFIQISATPEPGTLALTLTGLALVLVVRKRIAQVLPRAA